MTELRVNKSGLIKNDHTAVGIAAKIISYLFHPLFVPVYIGWFLIYEVRLFTNLEAWQNRLLLVRIVVSYTLFPLVTLLLAYALGFVKSVYLKAQRDRIIPYIACEIFYFWAWYVFRNQHFPPELVMFSLAVFLATSLGLILNAYFKVSMHGLSMGVAAAFILLCGFRLEQNFGIYISVALLVSGMVCTARLINNDHDTREVYAGFIGGVLAQVIASFFV